MRGAPPRAWGAPLVFLAGCAEWTAVEKPSVRAPDGSFRFEATEGWMRHKERGGFVFLTRDGPPVQSLEARSLPSEEAFPLLGEGIPPGASWEELATLTITEVSAGFDPWPLAILEQEPTRIGANPGFRVHGRYTDEAGVSFDLLAGGFEREGRFYVVLFRAPTLQVFERDRAAFDRAIETLRAKGEREPPDAE